MSDITIISTGFSIVSGLALFANWMFGKFNEKLSKNEFEVFQKNNSDRIQKIETTLQETLIDFTAEIRVLSIVTTEVKHKIGKVEEKMSSVEIHK